MLNIRVIPNANIYSLRANGREYVVGSATYLDLPLADGGAVQNDQAQRIGFVGSTADRPTNVPGDPNFMPQVPPQMIDTTLGIVIYSTPNTFPVTWTDSTGIAA